MAIRIVFSDIDGTLLDSRQRISPATLSAIRSLQAEGIDFVIVSARSPFCITPILREFGFSCPIIAFSGGLIRDAGGETLHAEGFSRDTAAAVLSHLEHSGFDCAWNLYTAERWLVRDRDDPRVAREEEIVHLPAAEGGIGDIEEGTAVSKILCMCAPEAIEAVQESVRAAFPALVVSQSAAGQFEILPHGVNKRRAVETFCALRGIDPADTAAFGDQWNDLPMLEAAGHGYLMANAPEPLKEHFPRVTASNDEDGIVRALESLGLI